MVVTGLPDFLRVILAPFKYDGFYRDVLPLF